MCFWAMKKTQSMRRNGELYQTHTDLCSFNLFSFYFASSISTVLHKAFLFLSLFIKHKNKPKRAKKKHKVKELIKPCSSKNITINWVRSGDVIILTASIEVNSLKVCVWVSWRIFNDSAKKKWLQIELLKKCFQVL